MMQLPNPRRLDELVGLSIDGLTAWLRQGVVAFGALTDQRARLRAFSPVLLSAAVRDDGAAEAVADALERVFQGSVIAPGEATVRVLEAWSLPQDGVAGAALLLQLADALGAVRLGEALEALVNKPSSKSIEPDRRLSSTIATVACERLPRASAERVGVQARRAGLLSPPDAARVLAYLTSDRLDVLVSLAVSMRLPAGPRDAVNEALTAQLMAINTADEVKAALKQGRSSPAEQAARDWVISAIAAYAPTRKPRRAWASARSTNPDVTKRLANLAKKARTANAERFAMIEGIANTYAGQSSTLDAVEAIDPGVDTASTSNVVSIWSKSANG